MATNNNNPFGDYYSTMMESDPQMAYMAKLGSQTFGYNPLTFAGQAPTRQPSEWGGKWGSSSFAGEAPVQQKRARDYFADQYSNIYNEYMSKKGREYQQKVDPSKMTTFSDFLSEIPFTTRYSGLTPYQRGMSTQRFAPSTRHIYY